MRIGLPQMICAELVWSGSVDHWLGENSSILLAVEISGRGSLYYKENAVNNARFCAIRTALNTAFSRVTRGFYSVCYQDGVSGGSRLIVLGGGQGGASV